jgi:hypothetical protein
MAYVNFSNLKEKYQNEIQYCRNLKIGDKIKFKSEKQRYTIRAKSDRFIICTKPFNAKKTFLYTIIDLDRLVRGAIGLVFGLAWDFDIPEELEECLKQLDKKEVEVSHRNCIQLDVEIS